MTRPKPLNPGPTARWRTGSARASIVTPSSPTSSARSSRPPRPSASSRSRPTGAPSSRRAGASGSIPSRVSRRTARNAERTGAAMPVLIGTSGWQYESWRRRFHDGVPQRRWFEHTMAAFRTVELNVTFYRLPSHETFAGWHRRSPDDAVITVKASRYLTHIRRLRDPAEPVERLLSRADGLGEKLGPILVQLPPDMRADIPALATALDAFGRHRRVAVETRHESWWTEPVCASLAERGVAHVWADRGGEAQGPTWRTAPWGYV